MIIGIVGGVGCGKSTVLTYLKEKYNAYIIEADKVAKEIMEKGNEVYNKVIREFPESLDKDDNIDRKKLAKIVFNDAKKLETLNNITHPGTIKEITDRINNSSNQLVIVESAILIGSGIDKMCDEIWYVYCDLEKRIKRLMDSRGYSEEKTRNVIMNQMSEEEFNRVSDEFIDNSNSEEETHEQIDFETLFPILLHLGMLSLLYLVWYLVLQMQLLILVLLL